MIPLLAGGVLTAAFSGVFSLALQERAVYQDPSQPSSKRVSDLLARMTLQEKVAQTHCLWPAVGINAPFRGKQLLDDQGDFDSTKAAPLLRHGMGQIARPSESKQPRRNALYTNSIQRFLVEGTRLGIPAIFHEEGLHGHMAPGGTSYPQASALASTWDTELVRRVFEATALEMRARGGHQALTPVLDLALDARWGRFEETYGEDPFLVSRMGVAAIRGFQGEGPAIDGRHVMATMKHFAAHGQPESGSNTGPAYLSERYLRETFLRPFEAAVREAGVRSVMASYNEIDGIPAHANRWLLDRLLRQEWGFRGTIVGDYFAIGQLHDAHRVASDADEAGRQALEAGVDIELPEPLGYLNLASLVEQGRVAAQTLDRSVSRLLEAKFSLGLFDDPYVDPDGAESVVNQAPHRELALRAARKAITLLKNEGSLLPLDRDAVERLAVIGPNADGCLLGGYSDDPGRCVSVLDGVRRLAGNALEVTYAEGCHITQEGDDWWSDEVQLSDPAADRERIREAAEVAREADAALLVVGGNDATSREAYSNTHLGDRDSLELLGLQNQLVEAVLETGTPTVALLLHGRPLAVNFIAERVPAILDGWYLGQEGGTAVGEVLFGDVNPAGRLPVTIPRSVGQIPAYYFHKPTARRGYLFASNEPLFPFGHGLSYTTFSYSALTVSPERIGPAGSALVSVRVTNNGPRAGEEVVQLYVRDLVASVTRPVKQLEGFQRVWVEAGDSKQLEFELSPENLALWNQDFQRVVEPGEFEVMVGGSSTRLASVRLTVEQR